MTLTELRKKIETKTTEIAVIGLGYVGLPVEAAFASERALNLLDKARIGMWIRGWVSCRSNI